MIVTYISEIMTVTITQKAEFTGHSESESSLSGRSCK